VAVPPGSAPDEPAERAWTLDVSDEALAAIREGARAVTSPGGTAFYSASLELWDIMGKSGSAQTGGATNAWFAGMAGPKGGGAPEIVVVALVEDVGPGQGGSSVAAPIVAKAADFYLRTSRGMEVPELQTLAEHIRSGPWPAWAPDPFNGG